MPWMPVLHEGFDNETEPPTGCVVHHAPLYCVCEFFVPCMLSKSVVVVCPCVSCSGGSICCALTRRVWNNDYMQRPHTETVLTLCFWVLVCLWGHPWLASCQWLPEWIVHDQSAARWWYVLWSSEGLHLPVREQYDMVDIWESETLCWQQNSRCSDKDGEEDHQMRC